jgi:hypothetical protein
VGKHPEISRDRPPRQNRGPGAPGLAAINDALKHRGIHRINHGKGTGTLRAEIRRCCDSTRRSRLPPGITRDRRRWRNGVDSIQKQNHAMTDSLLASVRPKQDLEDPRRRQPSRR